MDFSGILATDLFWSSLKWLLVFSAWAFFALGSWREDRHIRMLFARAMNESEAVSILRVLNRRSLQTWLVLLLLIIVAAANDLHHDAALLPAANDTIATPALPPVAPEKSPADAAYDKILQKNATSALPFSAVTEFNEQNGKREAYIDLLKERYESWLVTYYYLQHCKAVASEDYDFIHHALEADLKSAQAELKVEANILTAAAGSYKEMYSSIPCDADHIKATKPLYDANMQQSRQPLATQPIATPAGKPPAASGVDTP